MSMSPLCLLPGVLDLPCFLADLEGDLLGVTFLGDGGFTCLNVGDDTIFLGLLTLWRF